jgi:hypothetical protein
MCGSGWSEASRSITVGIDPLVGLPSVTRFLCEWDLLGHSRKEDVIK